MQLYILDKCPIKSAQLVPDKYKFKMLIELGQLICSAGLSDVYKPVPQGKELQCWIKEYPQWTFKYYDTLYKWTWDNINLKDKTKISLNNIWWDLHNYSKPCGLKEPKYTYFRYAKEYKCDIPIKTLLPIDECIAEYRKYLEWKLSA